MEMLVRLNLVAQLMDVFTLKSTAVILMNVLLITVTAAPVVSTKILYVMITIYVHKTSVIPTLDATMSLMIASVTIITNVLLTVVKLTLDASTSLLTVMIMMLQPLIIATLLPDVYTLNKAKAINLSN